MTDDNITTCRVKNKHDDLFITLCAEWLENSGLKITIFTDKSTPLIGQMKLSDAETYANNLSKTCSDYLEITRTFLSGKDSSVEFVLKDSKFRWKKGRWNYGIIEVVPAGLDEVFPELLIKFIDRHAELKKTIDEIKSQNEELRVAHIGLEEKMEEIITLKNRIEEDLYRRFIVVLNSKKEKIRELENELRKRIRIDDNKGDKKGIFEAETEESDLSEGEKVPSVKQERTQGGGRINAESFLSRNSNSGEKLVTEEKLFKREASDSDGKMIDSDCENERRKMKRNYNSKQSMTEGEPSTSKYKNDIDEGEDRKEKIKLTYLYGNRNSKSVINSESEGSEEDMFT